jgi:hypothetical protein
MPHRLHGGTELRSSACEGAAPFFHFALVFQVDVGVVSIAATIAILAHVSLAWQKSSSRHYEVVVELRADRRQFRSLAGVPYSLAAHAELGFRVSM